MTTDETCRLCRGKTVFRFSLKVLGKYDVSFFQCSSCSGLQSEKPYWLEESYKFSLAQSDVGVVQRCLTARAKIATLQSILRKKFKLLDYGGGTGLLCRLLRDVGINAWMFDKYGTGEISQGYKIDEENISDKSNAWGMVTALEVIEHFPNPAQDMSAIMELNPEIFICSTQIITDKINKDWWYLSPETGQHVFFYSEASMQHIANRFNYHLLLENDLQIFSKTPLSALNRVLVRLMFSRIPIRLLRMLIESISTKKHLELDHKSAYRQLELALKIDERARSWDK